MSDDGKMQFLVLATTPGAIKHRMPIFVMAKSSSDACVVALQTTRHLEHVGNVEFEVFVLDQSTLNPVLESAKAMAWHYWQVGGQTRLQNVDDRDAFEDEWAEYGAGRLT